MAIEVQMPKDVRKIKTKFKSFTKEQLIGLARGGIAFGVSFSILPIKEPAINFTIALLIGILAFLPCVITPYNQPFSIFMTRFFVYTFIVPPKRKIERKNEIKEEYIALQKERENNKVKKMTPKEKKQYLAKKKTVVYSQKPKYKRYV